MPARRREYKLVPAVKLPGIHATDVDRIHVVPDWTACVAVTDRRAASSRPLEEPGRRIPPRRQTTEACRPHAHLSTFAFHFRPHEP